ncbi:uncharacterized protein LOC143032341 isoform X2 [Oratosquilla oratoria]
MRVSRARIGSAQPSCSTRPESGRPSEFRRSRPFRGRPSSAPVPSSPAQHHCGAAKEFGAKTKDVSSLNLTIEGKSIKSIAYVPRRLQASVVRHTPNCGYGSYSSRRRQVVTSRKLCHQYSQKPVVSSSCFLRSGHQPVGDFHQVSIPLKETHIKPRDGFGETFTIKKDDSFGGYYETSVNQGILSDREYLTEYLSRPVSRVLDREEIHDNLLRSVWKDENNDLKDLSDDHGYDDLYSRDIYNRRPLSFSVNTSVSRLGATYQTSGVSESQHHVTFKQPKCDMDTISNDGSECTVMSLGKKIQLMATSDDDEKHEKASDEKQEQKIVGVQNWDSEWKELLRQNNELLLKLSSRDDHYPCQIQPLFGESRSANVHHMSSQTNGDNKENMEDINVSEENPQSQPLTSLPNDMESLEEECVLEDIIEESSGSETNSFPFESVILNESNSNFVSHEVDDSSCSSPVRESKDILQDSSPSPNVGCTVEDQNSTNDKENYNKSANQSVPFPQPTKQATEAIDFSCTANLPTHHTGQATSCVMRCHRPREWKGKRQTSKDLMDVLQLIEDEEKKDAQKLTDRSNDLQQMLEALVESEQHIEPPIPKVSSTETNTVVKRRNSLLESPTKSNDMLKKEFTSPLQSSSSSPKSVASLPAIQVLVEKVQLFTQDLYDRWQERFGTDVKESKGELLEAILTAEKQLEEICIKEGNKEEFKKEIITHDACDEKLKKAQQNYEERIQKNLELIRKVLDDKKVLTEQCEKFHKEQRILEKRHNDKLKAMEKKYDEEQKLLKEKLTLAEQERREKWTQYRTKQIKESTYKGIETKIKDLTAKHRDEISQLKAEHWNVLKEMEEKGISQLRLQEQELKKNFQEEKDAEYVRQREREQQRLNIELRQCEQLSQSRLEDIRKQNDRSTRNLIEEHHRVLQELKLERETLMREHNKKADKVKDDYEEQIRNLKKNHEAEIQTTHLQNEKIRSEWEKQFIKKHEESKATMEKELRERLKRQRDKEIERAIKEIKQEVCSSKEEERKSNENKIRSIRDQYEHELSELESSERAARSRYLEMKSVLAQKEEEIIYLRARLHTQDLELCELQHMFHPTDD